MPLLEQVVCPRPWSSRMNLSVGIRDQKRIPDPDEEGGEVEDFYDQLWLIPSQLPPSRVSPSKRKVI
uniref:Uncharacterized protein n=1 Tax=Arundo donax TaxID=35708 RepID=A0A0A9G9E9_ARUDO